MAVINLVPPSGLNSILVDAMDIASEGFWVTVTVFSTSPDRILKEAVRSSGEVLPDAVTLIEFDPAGPSAGLMEHHPPAGSLAKEADQT